MCKYCLLEYIYVYDFCLVFFQLDKTVQDGFAKLTNKYKMPTVSHGKVDTTDVISRLIDMVFIEVRYTIYAREFSIKNGQSREI